MAGTTEHTNNTQNKSYYARSPLQTDTKPSPVAVRNHQQNTYQLHRRPRNTSKGSVRPISQAETSFQNYKPEK